MSKGPSRWVQCTAPNCAERRNGMAQLNEHITAAHGGATNRMLPGAQEIVPGTDEIEDGSDEAGIVAFLESMAQDQHTKVTHGKDDSTGKVDRALVEALDTYMFKGKRYAEKARLWKTDGTPKDVPIKDVTTALLRWGYLRKQPSQKVWSKKFKHILCPVESCKFYEGDPQPCPKGHMNDDGSAPMGECMSTPGNEEYALVHHLSRGNMEHKFYFAINEDELRAKLKTGFKMVEMQNKVEATYKKSARKELTAV